MSDSGNSSEPGPEPLYLHMSTDEGRASWLSEDESLPEGIPANPPQDMAPPAPPAPPAQPTPPPDYRGIVVEEVQGLPRPMVSLLPRPAPPRLVIIEIPAPIPGTSEVNPDTNFLFNVIVVRRNNSGICF